MADVDLLGHFEQLHRPVYGVYGLGDQGLEDQGLRDQNREVDGDAIHRLLASSFAGEALTHEYVEHFTTLARMQQERTSIQVLRVDYESVRLLQRQPESARIEADWSVSGVVTHQGHRHPRINRYRALYTVAKADAPHEDAMHEDARHETDSEFPIDSPPVEVVSNPLRIVDTRLLSAERTRSSQPLGAFDAMPSSAAGTLSMEELLRSGLADEMLEASAEGSTGTNESRQPSAAAPP